MTGLAPPDCIAEQGDLPISMDSMPKNLLIEIEQVEGDALGQAESCESSEGEEASVVARFRANLVDEIPAIGGVPTTIGETSRVDAAFKGDITTDVDSDAGWDFRFGGHWPLEEREAAVLNALIQVHRGNRWRAARVWMAAVGVAAATLGTAAALVFWRAGDGRNDSPWQSLLGLAADVSSMDSIPTD